MMPSLICSIFVELVARSLEVSKSMNFHCSPASLVTRSLEQIAIIFEKAKPLSNLR